MLVLWVLAAGLLGALALDSGGRVGVFAGAALVATVATPLVRRFAVWRLDGPAVYGLACLLTFGVTALAWLNTPQNPGPGLVRDDIGPALVLVAAGLAAFALGVRALGPGARPLLRPLQAAEAPSPRALLVVYGIAAAVFAAAIATGRYGYTSDAGAGTGPSAQLISLAASASGIVVLVAAVAYFATGEVRLRQVLFAVVGVQAALGLVSGVKGESLGPLLFCTLAFVAYRDRMPWRGIAGVAIVTLLVLIPVNIAYREAIRHERRGTIPALVSAATNPELLRIDRAPVRIVRYAEERFRHVDHVALIQQRTGSEFARGDGSHYLLLPLIVAIPRALWPDKPVLDESAQFSHTYWEIPPPIQTATPVTQPGDLYRNFGTGGVLIGLLLWGVLVGLWSRLLARRPTPRMLAVHLYALVYVISYVENDLPSIVATASRTFPAVAAIVWLLLPGADGVPGFRRIAAAVQRVSVRPGRARLARRAAE
ncbi:MAG: hypothetical protein LC744_00070 [Chloroflexi bacterium]|nr:hypothetical protein [Chloroflexota bacterium]